MCLITQIFVFCLIALLMQNCQQQNHPSDSFAESDAIKEVVSYINYNFTRESRVNGISELILESTQPLDEYYYGYDASPETLLSGIPGLEKSDYFLDNDNKDLSIYLVLDEPSPDTNIELTIPVYIPFADGFFPSHKADFFVARVQPVSLRTIRNYDSNDAEIPESPYIKWTIQYNSSDIPNQWDQDCTDPSTDTLTSGCDYGLSDTEENSAVARKRVIFATDTRTYSDYYANGYIYYDTTGDVLAQLQVSRAGDEYDHTFTSTCFSADGTSLTTSYCGLSDSLVNSAAKTIETFVLSSLDTSPDARQYQIVKKYYDTSNDEFYRWTKVYTYLNEDTFQPVSLLESVYSIDPSGDLTPIEEKTYSYSNSFLTKKVSNLYNEEELVSSMTYEYGRDAQGRINDYLVKDASGDSVLHAEYSFDTDGWLKRVRSYDFTNAVENETPVCGENYDFDYSKDVYGYTTKTITNYCNDTTYQTTPYEIVSNTYDSKGMLTSYKLYKISGSNAYVSSRIDYEYDDQGFNTKIQHYEGEGSSMQAASYQTRERDDHLFLTVEKNYNTDGDLITDLADATSDCQSGENCYSVISYTYR